MPALAALLVVVVAAPESRTKVHLDCDGDHWLLGIIERDLQSYTGRLAHSSVRNIIRSIL